MNQIAIRVGLVISAITIFTFVWTALIQPILTLQQQVQLLNYRLSSAEKQIEVLSQQKGLTPRQSLGTDIKNESQGIRKNP